MLRIQLRNWRKLSICSQAKSTNILPMSLHLCRKHSLFSSPPLPSLPAPDHGLFLLLNSVSHACSSTQTAVLQLPPAHQFSSLSVSKIILFDKVGSHLQNLSPWLTLLSYRPIFLVPSIFGGGGAKSLESVVYTPFPFLPGFLVTASSKHSSLLIPKTAHVKAVWHWPYCSILSSHITNPEAEIDPWFPGRQLLLAFHLPHRWIPLSHLCSFLFISPSTKCLSTLKVSTHNFTLFSS